MKKIKNCGRAWRSREENKKKEKKGRGRKRWYFFFFFFKDVIGFVESPSLDFILPGDYLFFFFFLAFILEWFSWGLIPPCGTATCIMLQPRCCCGSSLFSMCVVHFCKCFLGSTKPPRLLTTITKLFITFSLFFFLLPSPPSS